MPLHPSTTSVPRRAHLPRAAAVAATCAAAAAILLSAEHGSASQDRPITEPKSQAWLYYDHAGKAASMRALGRSIAERRQP